MNRKVMTMLLGSAFGMGAFTGCCATPQRSGYFAPPPGPAAPCATCTNGGPLPPRFTPTPNPYPPPSNPLPPGSPPSPASEPTPTPPADIPPRFQQEPPSARLAPPEQAEPNPPRDPARERAQLYPPQTPEPPVASIPPTMPPAKEEQPAAPSLPADIPQFATARPKVAAGQQPFPDGVTWLQKNGYRTVLHVRAVGDTDTAAQRIFEKRGLRYVSLEVGPQKLNKEIVEQFNRFVTDEANLPLFVFDRDGSLAGALWYLYFRTAEGASDEKARTEAARLGFKIDQDDNHRTMWLAVQNYLRNQNP